MVRVLDAVRSSIERHCLLEPGDWVVVGVSGGPDSLCLLHGLCRLRREYRLALHVAHLHHGLRGAEADADAEFVQLLAQDWGVPSTVERVDVPALAAEHRLAVEEAARRARYAFLSRVAESVGARTIAVGHNADDQTETVLMHFLRGSGLAGLRGMLPRMPLKALRLDEPFAPAHPSHSLVLARPLLNVTRAEIEAYCDSFGLEPRFDRSNLDTTFFRNWLRHKVIPLLAEHNPNVREVIRRTSRVITDDYALLRSLLEDTWARVVVVDQADVALSPTVERVRQGRVVFDLHAWRALHTSLQRSTLREAVFRLRRSLRDVTYLHVEHALQVARDGTTGDQATFPQGLMMTVGYDCLTIADAGMPDLLPAWPLLPRRTARLPTPVPGLTRLPGSEWALDTELLDRADLPPGWATGDPPWRAFLDARAIEGGVWLRTRRPGDRFQPQGMEGHTVKLADFLTNQKVPHSVRDLLPLLEGQRGILWVCGQRVDQRACVTDETDRVLAVCFLRSDLAEETSKHGCP